MAEPFQFKKFLIHQDKCKMKVGTDAVLLGAWADPSDANSILDIGTGTGVIAIMLAQKCDAIIDAIDIDEASCRQAEINSRLSPWGERIHVIFSSIQQYCLVTEKKYDYIISNPPYFGEEYREKASSADTAKHSIQLPFSDLVGCVCKLLAPDGKFCVILPYLESSVFCELAIRNKLFPQKALKVKTTAGKAEKRILIEFGFEKIKTEEMELLMMTSENSYTEEYIALTRDYYLNFA
jgi:tRNA1Val (adenine37-N6)-methyltransferase